MTIKPNTLSRCATALALLLATTSAAALTMDTQGGVSYITGGIGRDEVETIQAERSRFPLTMEFTEATGKRNRYISDVAVTITNPQGASVLMVTTDGPFLLVDLPPGTYHASAIYNGLTREKTLTVGGGAKRSVWVWPASSANEPVPTPEELQQR